jgi:FPC/CPF motif-containing protein YcgG
VQILETIAHELVHSEQTKQNRLSRTGRNRERVYHGQVYHTQVGNYTEYLNRPWEKEARQRAAAFIQELSHDGTLALEK